MIKILKSLQEIEQFCLPFLTYTPKTREAYDISVRIHDRKWPTLRYSVKLSGKEIRVKQFFMDWFFPGFPKSLLKDFASGYSNIRSRTVRDYSLFLGRNYRKKDAASAWLHGTTVEMESHSNVSDDEYENLLLDITASPPNPGRLIKYQFPDRSHFAKGYEGDWYEDQRVGRLAWRRTGKDSLTINNHRFQASGLGYAQVNGNTHEILLFQEDDYSRAIWIELTTKEIGLEHAVYDVRKGEGFFDTEVKLAEDKGILVFRKPLGPAVVRVDLASHILTSGFSPGLGLEDLSAFISSLNEIIATIGRINESTPHNDAKL